MKKQILYLADILLIAVIVAGVSGCDTIAGPADSAVPLGTQQTGIWVTGEGKVTVVPDLAILSLGVEVQKDTVSEAYDIASQMMSDIIQSLVDNGISEEDIKTQYFHINQETDYRGSQPDIIVGYTVTNIAEIKIRDIDNASSILNKAVTAGSDYVRIRSFGFTVDDPTVYYDEAREKALASAREKAEQIADKSDLRLGNPTFISESTGYNPYSIDYGMSLMAPVAITESTIFVSPGQTEVTIIMQVAYSID